MNQLPDRCQESVTLCRGPRRIRDGFTLIEVIIVTLLLAVLMGGVWSMFQMQNRMMLKGESLSRRGSVAQSLWQQFQDDVRSIQLPGSADNRSVPRQTTSSVSEFLSDVPTLDGVATGESLDGIQDNADQLLPASFLLIGERDWLVLDRQRPWQQWPGLPAGESSTSTTYDQSSTSLTSPEAGRVTGYRRVMYVWLSTEEVNQVFGLNLSDAPAETVTESSVADQTSLATNRLETTPARWLFRLSRDWNDQPETSSLADNATDQELAVTQSSAFDSSARKQRWLDWFLDQPKSRFQDFHQWQGNLAEDSTLEWQPTPGFDSIATPRSSWIPDPGQVQISWLTTVTDGQLQYLVDGRWRSSLSPSTMTRSSVRAIELQYQIDPNHLPAIRDDGALADGTMPLTDPDDGLDSLPGFDSLEEPADDWNQQVMGAETSIRLPTFEHVCLVPLPVSFTNANRQSQTSDFASPSTDAAPDVNNPSSPNLEPSSFVEGE